MEQGNDAEISALRSEVINARRADEENLGAARRRGEDVEMDHLHSISSRQQECDRRSEELNQTNSLYRQMSASLRSRSVAAQGEQSELQ